MIRENPASRGTETSAEVLVGPPLGAGGWSETPVNSSGTRLTPTLDGGLEGPPRPVMAPYPFPSASSVGVGRRIKESAKHAFAGANRGFGSISVCETRRCA